jgi:hypothetical protein
VFCVVPFDSLSFFSLLILYKNFPPPIHFSPSSNIVVDAIFENYFWKIFLYFVFFRVVLLFLPQFTNFNSFNNKEISGKFAYVSIIMIPIRRFYLPKKKFVFGFHFISLFFLLIYFELFFKGFCDFYGKKFL